MRLSASSAQRVELCPASAVLPAVEHESAKAAAGSAGHEHMEQRVRLGVDAAVELLDETLAKWNLNEREASFLRVRLLKFEWTPPAGSLTEVRLALMPDYSVKQVPRDQRFFEGALFTGASDVIYAEPKPLTWVGEGDDARIVCPPDSVLVVGDLKYGSDAWVTTIESNLQVAIYAFMAARWLGAKRVLPAVIYPGPGNGEWDAPRRPWGKVELGDIEARIQRMLENVEKTRLRLAANEPVTFNEGRHCEYCPAHSACPAKVRLFKNVLSDDAPEIFGMVGGLDGESAKKLVEVIAQMGHFVRHGREVLERYVEVNGPIDMGDGLVWGPEATEKTKINGEVAREVLIDELGEHASGAFEITGAAIERAVKAKLDGARGAQPIVRRIYAKIGERGGLRKEPGKEFKVHRPDGSAPALPPPGTRLVEQLEQSVAANESADAAVVRFRGRRR